MSAAIQNGTTLVLNGKTRKGQNRVRELGTQWRLLRTEATVAFSQDRGPWGLIEPLTNPDKWRWVNLQSDRDFGVTALTGSE